MRFWSGLILAAPTGVNSMPRLENIGPTATQGLPRGLKRLLLDLRLLLQNSQRRQVVFHFLKSGQHGLPVSCHGCVVSRARLVGLGPAQTAIEQGLGYRRSN